MPTSAAAIDSVLFMAVTSPAAIMLADAAAQAPAAALEIIPVSAGLSGAIVCALKMHLGVKTAEKAAVTGNVWRFITTAGSGAAATIFTSPWLVSTIGFVSVPSSMFVHFVIGLIGSALCDKILGIAPTISDWVVDLAKKTAFGGK